MSTILVRGNAKSKQYGNLVSLSACESPLWLAILANFYKADAIIDAEVNNLSFEETIEQIKKSNPTRVIILPTGNHPSSHIQQKEISKKIYLELIKRNINVLLLDSLPVSPIQWGSPRWDLLNMTKYCCHNWHSFSNDCKVSPYGTIYTSISCPYSCKFCEIKNFYGKTYEVRLIEDVIKDFNTLGKKGIKNIKIMDELFILNSNRVNLICDEVSKLDYDFNIWCYGRIDTVNNYLLKSMKKAGINWIAYGIEAGSEEIRKEVVKGNFTNNKIREVIKMTKDNGINCLGNYMFGFWNEKLNHLKETLDFALELNCEFVNLYCLSAFPNTPLYDFYKEKGIKYDNYEEYAQMSPNFKPLPTKYLKAKEVLEFRDKAFLQYITNSKYLSMMNKKFGHKVIQELRNMTSIKIKRNEIK